MGTNLNIQVVNGLCGDPAVFAYLPQLGEAVLFDAGELDRLSNRELLKIRTVCISHTHVDHFIGFDRLLRVNVPHFRTLEVIGPKGITKNICGKIAAYTWNLLEPDQINFLVHEVMADGSVESFKVSNNNHFLPTPLPTPAPEFKVKSPGAVIPLSHSNYFISAVVLDHGTDVCAFSLRLPDTLAVSKEALDELGLTPGPWIGDLQRFATKNQLNGEIEVSPGVAYDIKTLADKILATRQGDSVAYVTDILFSKDNLERMVTALGPVSRIVCETNYRHEHQNRAFEKKHLTTRQAALIAVSLRAKSLNIFHVSNIYGDSPEPSDAESQTFYEEFSSASPQELQMHLASEFEGYAQLSK